MEQYIVHNLAAISDDEICLKLLSHTTYLVKNFYKFLRPLESLKKRGFMFIKSEKKHNWNFNLYSACHGGNLNLVNFMLEKGGNDLNGAFLIGCQEGNQSLVNWMISKGVCNWNGGLYHACERGHMGTVNLLIEKGANDWNMGLYGACEGGHSNLMSLMVLQGAIFCFNCNKSLEWHLKANQDP